LDDLGLKEALTLYVERWQDQSGIAGEFHSTGFDQERLPVEIETNLYRITQEALNNVAKHSKSTRVCVILERRGTHAVLIIEDNGVGFEIDERSMPDIGFGMVGMRERAALIGAEFEVESNPQKGTTIFVRVPIMTRFSFLGAAKSEIDHVQDQSSDSRGPRDGS
jgi:signal transduction histidine kinase